MFTRLRLRLLRRPGTVTVPPSASANPAATPGSSSAWSDAAPKIAAFALVVGGTLGFSSISHDTTSGLETTIACAVVAKAFDRPEGPDGLVPLPA
jgi:hypothetical protein